MMTGTTLLDQKLKVAGIPIAGISLNGDGSYRLDFLPEATQVQRDQAAAIVAAFDAEAEEAAALAIFTAAAEFEGLPDWASYTTTEAVAAIHDAIFAGATLATVNAQIDALPATIAGMKTGLKAVVAEIITERGILEKMAKAIVYLRDRT